MAPRVLVVDHDRAVRNLASKHLAAAGLEVSTAAGGRQALVAISGMAVDMVILDLMLPDMDGIDLCRQLRRRTRVPLLVMAEAQHEVERYLALEVGADDFLIKPLVTREFSIRVRAHLRRWLWQQEATPQTDPELLRVGELLLDLSGRRASLRGNPLHLTPTEFHLLRVLCQAPGIAFPRERLFALATGRPVSGDARQVDVHIRSLRLKLELDPAHPRFLQTVRGAGYRVQGVPSAP
ncbi:MAG TPA: response regulator transcription factor [Symbiobacteriaceae bacterium]|nr:response regulator transcription factor [Symbiobacteriaceae bacterium]